MIPQRWDYDVYTYMACIPTYTYKQMITEIKHMLIAMYRNESVSYS
uniref:Uncharacterized protein n=1 Tax=viral metagenome TaxID=1070528 RepID=A0A6C0LZQ3_9ZZZZ